MDQRCVLVGHGQAQLAGQSRRIPSQRFAPDLDGSQIGVYKPARNAEERRFSGAVLAHKGMDLAAAAVKADVGQRPHRPELARDTTELEDDVSGGHQLANINPSTSSGTSDVPDTAGVARSGLQSAAVTWRIT